MTSQKDTVAFLTKALSFEDVACLIWPFGTGKDGYPTLRIGGKTQRLNRYLCENRHGLPFAKAQVAHRCGNRKCINPKHLYWATAKENAADRLAHGTENIGERNGNTNLTVEDVNKIRQDLRTHRLIAVDYDVDRSTISAIKRGDRWGRV